MDLRSQMAADLAVVHADPSGPSEQATYKAGGTGTKVTRITIVRTGRQEQQFDDGIWEIETAQAYVLVADVPVTLFTDTIVVASVNGGTTDTWFVRRIFSENAAIRELQIIRQIQKRLSGQGDERSRVQGAMSQK